MNASRHPEDTRISEPAPPPEAVPGPVAHQRAERRWFGLPSRFVLLCLGCAAFGAAIGLFATGNWGWGIVCILLAAILFAALTEALKQGGGLWPEQSTRLAADGRAQAATAAAVWRTRLETSLTRWRMTSRLDRLELERAPLLQALGEAHWQGDEAAAREAHGRLEELEERRSQLEAELAEELAGAEERIRRARLPVQETVM